MSSPSADGTDVSRATAEWINPLTPLRLLAKPNILAMVSHPNRSRYIETKHACFQALNSSFVLMSTYSQWRHSTRHR